MASPRYQSVSGNSEASDRFRKELDTMFETLREGLAKRGEIALATQKAKDDFELGLMAEERQLAEKRFQEERSQSLYEERRDEGRAYQKKTDDMARFQAAKDHFAKQGGSPDDMQKIIKDITGSESSSFDDVMGSGKLGDVIASINAKSVEMAKASAKSQKTEDAISAYKDRILSVGGEVPDQGEMSDDGYKDLLIKTFANEDLKNTQRKTKASNRTQLEINAGRAGVPIKDKDGNPRSDSDIVKDLNAKGEQDVLEQAARADAAGEAADLKKEAEDQKLTGALEALKDWADPASLAKAREIVLAFRNKRLDRDHINRSIKVAEDINDVLSSKKETKAISLKAILGDKAFRDKLVGANAMTPQESEMFDEKDGFEKAYRAFKSSLERGGIERFNAFDSMYSQEVAAKTEAMEDADPSQVQSIEQILQQANLSKLLKKEAAIEKLYDDKRNAAYKWLPSRMVGSWGVVPLTPAPAPAPQGQGQGAPAPAGAGASISAPPAVGGSLPPAPAVYGREGTSIPAKGTADTAKAMVSDADVAVKPPLEEAEAFDPESITKDDAAGLFAKIQGSSIPLSSRVGMRPEMLKAVKEYGTSGGVDERDKVEASMLSLDKMNDESVLNQDDLRRSKAWGRHASGPDKVAGSGLSGMINLVNPWSPGNLANIVASRNLDGSVTDARAYFGKALDEDALKRDNLIRKYKSLDQGLTPTQRVLQNLRGEKAVAAAKKLGLPTGALRSKVAERDKANSSFNKKYQTENVHETWEKKYAEEGLPFSDDWTDVRHYGSHRSSVMSGFDRFSLIESIIPSVPTEQNLPSNEEFGIRRFQQQEPLPNVPIHKQGNLGRTTREAALEQSDLSIPVVSVRPKPTSANLGVTEDQRRLALQMQAQREAQRRLDRQAAIEEEKRAENEAYWNNRLLSPSDPFRNR